MALLNKDQLKFHSYKDAKLLMKAIEKMYGGNKESKKVQRTLLKQQYENFSGSSSEIMDQTFDRLQKHISQLEIQGKVIEQEDMNLKLLRSLPSEWKTNALIWRNKEEIETIGLDDLLGHVHFKRMQDMSKDGLIPAFDMDIENDLCDLHATPSLGNKKYFLIFIDDASRFCYVYLLHSKEEALDKFKSVGIIYETTAPYTLQQNGISERKNKVLKEMVNSMLSYSGLSHGFYGEAIVWRCWAVVRLPDPKLKTLGERGIECIFVGYVEHSKAFRFYVIEPNDSVAINSIIKLRDVIFDERRFSYVPRLSQRSLVKGTENSSGLVVSKRVTDEIDDPKTFDEAMKSQDVVFWKEAINDEMDSIMGNNTWVLTDLLPGCRPIGCKWIFKRKVKVDRTVEKFKARLVIQDFKQKSWIDYFDTYSLVARISIIRLVIAMESIHNLIIHQMDVKTAFLKEELEEEVYMNQPMGIILPGNENKVDLTKKFLSSRFSMKDMGEVDVILGIRIKHESNGIAISQSHYIEKVLKKFNYSDCTLVSTPLDTCEKLMPNKGLVVSQLEYSRVIGCLIYAITCTRPDITFDVGKLSRYPSLLEGYTDASWISNTEDNLSTSSWVFLLGGGAISWASKKQTCITGSIIKSEFVALSTVGKEAEWLKNLLLKIPLWVKPIAPISICCDSAATLANAYSQMYNGKSRHLGIRHSMIRELITNVVRDEAHVLQIIPRMCLEPADNEDEVANFSMVNFFEKVLSRSMNKEEPPMDLFIPVSGDRVSSLIEWNSSVVAGNGHLSIEPSAGKLLSGLAEVLGH
ncbi:zinc finger, CCHC-type containing protein [Tanacetum coccineum]